MNPLVNVSGAARAALVGAVLLAVAALGAWLAAQFYGPQRDAAIARAAAAQAQFGLALAANQRCDADVGKANDAVAKLKAEADERARAAAAALAQAQSRADAAQTRAADLAKHPPSKPDDLCASLDDLLTTQIRVRRAP